MSIKRLLTLIALLFCLSALSSACVYQDEVAEPALETQTQELANDGRICPAVIIDCAPGYEVKQMGNCQQTCVPVHGNECRDDSDCQIYCLVAPCDIGFCTAGTCRLRPSH